MYLWTHFFVLNPAGLDCIAIVFQCGAIFQFHYRMLNFDPEAFSLRWYEDILRNEWPCRREFSWAWLSDTWNNGQWIRAIRNSFFIGICATFLSTALGDLAAIGLS